MKYAIPIMLLTFLSNEQILAQLAGPPHLDVEGHVKIRGNIDIHNVLDSTTILIGAGAGDSLSFGELFDFFNTFVGVNAGKSNKNEFNSIFGALAGESSNGLSNSFFGAGSGQESSGNANSFFGGASGQNNTGHENAFFGIGAGANNAANNNSFFGSFSGGLNEGGTHNSFFGSNSGLSNFTGNDNSFFGFEAGLESGGDNNSFFGSQSGKNNGNGNDNSFFGAGAGKDNTSGASNTFMGKDAGNSNKGGGSNSFFGCTAGFSNENSSSNSFFGYESGYNNISGADNVFVGYQSGFSNLSHENVFVGYQAGKDNQSGDLNAYIGFKAGGNSNGRLNTCLGSKSGSSNRNGLENTYIGSSAGFNNLGNRSTFIGTFSGRAVGNDSINKAIAIGYSAKVACDNCAVIGGEGENAVKVGIGTSQPDRELTIFDADENGDAVISLKASNSSSREMILGVNQSSGGILSMQTNNDLFFRTNGTNRMVIENDGQVGIGTTAPTEKLDVDGNVRFRQVPTLPVLTDGSERVLYINTDGTLVKATSGTISDRRLKEDIKELQGALDQVTKLRGYSYYFKSDSSQTRQIGVMAQELERAYPELVLEDPESGYKRVQYPQLTAVLIQAIKEQQQQIELLKAKVQALEDQN